MILNQSFIFDFSEYYRRSQRTKIEYKSLSAPKLLNQMMDLDQASCIVSLG